jgi:hypothetical protein
MALKSYQVGELIGVGMVLLSTAMQLFYLEPLKREIEWRISAFYMQQNAQIQTAAMFGNTVAVLETMDAPASRIADTKAERDRILERYKTADANIADIVIDKEQNENYLQLIVVALFSLGTFLIGLGRAMEMRGRH